MSRLSEEEVKLVNEISSKIEEYKKEAAAITVILQSIENKRTRIVNHIEELTNTKELSRRMSHRLEDKLIRPYIFNLIKS